MNTSTNLLTRRQHLQTVAGSLAYLAMAAESRAANQNVAYGQATLPSSIRSRFIENVNGLTVHILEAGFETPDRPCVLFLHGFPELAYSWRKVMVRLARRVITQSRQISAASAAPRDGTRATKPTSLTSARLT